MFRHWQPHQTGSYLNWNTRIIYHMLQSNQSCVGMRKHTDKKNPKSRFSTYNDWCPGVSHKSMEQATTDLPAHYHPQSALILWQWLKITSPQLPVPNGKCCKKCGATWHHSGVQIHDISWPIPSTHHPYHRFHHRLWFPPSKMYPAMARPNQKQNNTKSSETSQLDNPSIR